LRTPLTAIIGELEVALMKPRDACEYERVLCSILDEATLLARLSNGMLQIAHASFDVSKIKLEPFRFDEIVFQAADEVKKRQTDCHIEISFAQAPDDERKLLCNGNESLMLIALLNVFENACKFSSARAQTVTGIISVASKIISLRVIDHGIGIHATDLKNIFVPFFRAENVREISGHGIGLPLAEKIIKLHRGTIQVKSEINIGTEVAITIPSLYFDILI
jgi:signal transduction histidine kinase